MQAIIVLQESQGRLKRAGTGRFYELRRFVFERLNTGGRKLNAQEIRNAVYGSPFNNLVTDLSRNPTFTRIWGIPPYTAADPNEYYEEPVRQKNTLYRTMADCQIVLRFFALREDEYIQGSTRSILDRCMERNLGLGAEQCNQLRSEYIERLELADDLFDEQPFELNLYGRSRPSVGVYDGMMVALDRLWDRRADIEAAKPKIQSAYIELVDTEAATGRLTGSANTSQDIKARIALFQDMIQGTL